MWLQAETVRFLYLYSRIDDGKYCLYAVIDNALARFLRVNLSRYLAVLKRNPSWLGIEVIG